MISLIEVPNPQDYGIISLTSDGFVVKITEKPSNNLKMGNLANAGIYLFNPIIFEAIQKTQKSVRNEFEFTDSMEILINELNGKIKAYIIRDEFWNDIGLPWQILDANKYMLSKIESGQFGEIEGEVKIKGMVYIGKDTKILAGTYIQGPCYIGENNLIGHLNFK